MVEPFEEVPGSRTVQPTQVLPGKADEIAYRDLKPGEVIQAGDEWRAESGQWLQISPALVGQTTGVRARRPYNITQMNLAIAMQTEVLAEVRADEEWLCQQLEALRSEYVGMQQQRDQAAHEYRLQREALTAAQAALKATMANGLQACRERDEAEQALKTARAELEETCRHRNIVIEERNEAERQCQHLRTALEELQRRRDAATGADAPTVAEVVENILSALEIASHALEYLAEVGMHEQAGHYSGFGAAIAVVRKIKEAAK